MIEIAKMSARLERRLEDIFQIEAASERTE